jgi:hypothetical protein
MKIYNRNASLENFEAWQGGQETKDKIIEEGKQDQFDNLISELYPDGIEETQLNDLLWFEEDWIYEMLGIEIED